MYIKSVLISALVASVVAAPTGKTVTPRRDNTFKTVRSANATDAVASNSTADAGTDLTGILDGATGDNGNDGGLGAILGGLLGGNAGNGDAAAGDAAAGDAAASGGGLDQLLGLLGGGGDAAGGAAGGITDALSGILNGVTGGGADAGADAGAADEQASNGGGLANLGSLLGGLTGKKH